MIDISNGNNKVSLTSAGQDAVIQIIASAAPTEAADFSDVNMEDVLKELSDRGLIKVEEPVEEPIFKGFGKKP